jgi:hypothetical protein
MTLYDLLLHYGSIPVIGSVITSKFDLLRPIIINWSIFIGYLSFVFLLFAIYIKGFFIHVFVILVGGKQNMVSTIQTLMYAVTPFFLLGWIPYIAILGLIWSVILCIVGLMVLQDLSAGRAVAVVVIPSALVIIGLITALFMIVSLFTALTHIL